MVPSIHNGRSVVVTIIITWIYLLTPVVGQGCTAGSCVECLNLNCAWFTVDEEAAVANVCLDVCNGIPTAPCYNDEIYANEAFESICARSETDIPDWTTCSVLMDCTSCVGTMQSDGVTSCSWYSEEGGYCGSGLCTDFGCGSTTCDDTSVPGPAPVASGPTTPIAPTADTSACATLTNATTCEECLISSNGTETGTNCAWSSNQCIASCSLVPDLPCYSSATQSDSSTPSEICLLVQSLSIDDDVCGEATECMECTQVFQTDASTTCLWFEGDSDETDVVPYCGAHNTTLSIVPVDMNGCNLNGICGVSDCSLVNVTRTNTPTVPPVQDTGSTGGGSPTAAVVVPTGPVTGGGSPMSQPTPTARTTSGNQSVQHDWFRLATIFTAILSMYRTLG